MTSWFKKVFGSGEEGLAESEGRELLPSENEEEGQLALDVYQDKDNVIVKSTIAGVRPENLDITITSETVAIRGERKCEEEIKEEDYFYQECYWGSFFRSVSLPVEVDPDKAEAEMKDGILTIVLPKASRVRAKKVRVRGEG